MTDSCSWWGLVRCWRRTTVPLPSFARCTVSIDSVIDAPYRFAMHYYVRSAVPVRPGAGRGRAWKKRQFRQLRAGQFHLRWAVRRLCRRPAPASPGKMNKSKETPGAGKRRSWRKAPRSMQDPQVQTHSKTITL